MEYEIRTDGRVSPETLFEKRKQAINFCWKGMRLKDISEATGPCRQAVRNAIGLCGRHGVKGLSPGRRGRPSDKGRRLAEEQDRQVRKDIRDRRPEQLKMGFVLWTCEAVLVYVRDTFRHRNADPHRRRVSQTPGVRAAEAHWSRLWAEAGGRKAMVGLNIPGNRKTRNKEKTPRGQTPTARTAWGSRQHFSMISSVNNQGKCHRMVIDEAFNADRLMESPESVVKDVPQKAFLVMDNLKAHHCKPVMAWPEEHRDRIEVFRLPSYSPEPNPDERLNADLKHAITTSVPKRTRAGLLAKTREHMEMAKATPERVKTYFRDRHVRYAAESM